MLVRIDPTPKFTIYSRDTWAIHIDTCINTKTILPEPEIEISTFITQMSAGFEPMPRFDRRYCTYTAVND